jgi:Alcohol dehydrogenase GroES-like domain
VDLCARHKRVAQSTRCDRGTKQPANDDSPKIIEETRQYIRDFDCVAGTTTTARELYDKMLELYSDPENPGLALCFRPVRPNRNTSNKNRRTGMHAMRAEKFSGYEGLKLVDLPKPMVSDGKVLLRMTAAGVTPLEHTILSSQFPLTKAPLVLGSEGAGVVEEGGGSVAG